MSRSLASAILVTAALLGASAPGARALSGRESLPDRLVLDPGATEVTFAVKARLHTVRGTLKVSEGEVSFDRASGRAEGRIVMLASSADTGNGTRDARMHEDVLESEQFPSIVFLPEHLTILSLGDHEAEIELAGTIDIHGLRHPLVIPAHLSRSSDERVTIAGSCRIPYVAWGMKDVSNFVLTVAPEASVTIEGSGRLEIGAP